MSEVFKKILFEDIDIPGRPDIVVKILNVLEDEYSSVERLEHVILEDPSLTSTLLKISNAPLYATGKSITTITESIMSIGLNNLVTLVSLAAVANHCIQVDCDKSILRHLLAVSSASSMLAEHVEKVKIKPEVAAIAGLLHDVGKPIIYISMPKEYAKIKIHARKENMPFINAEDELLGFNHCLVGSTLAKKWKLPPLYRDVIKAHHDEGINRLHMTEAETLCCLVRIADKMALDAGIGMSISGERHLADLMDMLGIKDAVYHDTREKLAAIASLDI